MYQGRIVYDYGVKVAIRMHCRDCKTVFIYSSTSLDFTDMMVLDEGWRPEQATGDWFCRACPRKKILGKETDSQPDL